MLEPLSQGTFFADAAFQSGRQPGNSALQRVSLLRMSLCLAVPAGASVNEQANTTSHNFTTATSEE